MSSALIFVCGQKNSRKPVCHLLFSWMNHISDCARPPSKRREKDRNERFDALASIPKWEPNKCTDAWCV